MDFVDEIYSVTRAFSKDEPFGLSSQMRRAAVSIPSNIAEGFGHGPVVFANHLLHVIGSLFELRTQVEIARRQAYISDTAAEALQDRAVAISKMAQALRRRQLK